jgi:hypothetical protein
MLFSHGHDSFRLHHYPCYSPDELHHDAMLARLLCQALVSTGKRIIANRLSVEFGAVQIVFAGMCHPLIPTVSSMESELGPVVSSDHIEAVLSMIDDIAQVIDDQPGGINY